MSSRCKKGKATANISILDLSKRTVTKILKRLKVGCCVCGWNDTAIDIHHIKPRSKGGSDDMSNLTPLCPNCHRKAHNGLLKKEEMLSLEMLYGDSWKDYYYNFENKWIPPLKEIALKQCPVCGKIIPRTHKTFCSNKCFTRYQVNLSKRPPKEKLEKEVQCMKITAVAKLYGVPHTRIAKWCDSLGIERPKRKSPSKKAPLL